MKKALALLLAAGMALSMVACSSGSTTSAGSEASGEEAAATGSGQNVRIICPYGAGGTADAIARKYAAVANTVQSDYNFYVENLTGGDGFAAATEYTEYDPSTTDLLIYGYGVAYRHDIGKAYGTEEVDFDRNEIQPVALIDDRTWIMYSTPENDLATILEKAANGGIKMSGGNPLSDPHLALGSLLAVTGGTVQVVPYDGGANQLKGLTDGEVDVFIGTTQAAQEYVEAGTVVPILAFSENAFEGFVTPDGPISVPCLVGEGIAPELDPSKDYTGSILPSGGSVAVRTGADQAWVDKIMEISQAVWATDEYTDWIASILLNKYEKYGDDAIAHYTEACEKALAAFELMSGEA